MTTKDLTARQSEVLNYIIKTVEATGNHPTFSEIGKALGINGPNAVAGHIRQLKAKGFLVDEPGKVQLANVRWEPVWMKGGAK